MPAHKGDGGFGLVEAIVSLAITAVALTALGAALMTGTRAAVAARAEQQAANILNEEVEQLRALDYAAISLMETDAALLADPDVDWSTKAYVPLGESLIVDSVGAVAHAASIERNTTEFTVRRFITDPADPLGQYKRIHVVVEWDSFGDEKTREVSTFVTDSRRGLPLPRFTVALNGTSSPQHVGMETEVVWGMVLRNLGARDAWTLESDDGQAWTYVTDADTDGVLDDSERALPLTVGAGGLPTTELVETNGAAYVLAYRTLVAAEVSPQMVQFSFASTAAPPPDSEARSVSTEVVIGGVPGATCGEEACTPTDYYLGVPNAGPNDTNPNWLSEGATPEDEVLMNAGLGRNLESSSKPLTETTVSRIVDFRFQVPKSQKREYTGQGSLLVWLSCPASREVVLHAVLGSSGKADMNDFTSWSTSQSVTPVACTGAFNPVQVMMPVASGQQNKYIALRLALEADPAVTARLAYGVSDYPARLTLPRMS